MDRIEVAISAPLFQTLSYSCDIDRVGNPVGRRVLVAMGRQRVTGYVLGLQPNEDVPYRILPVLKFLDATPLFPQNLVGFFRWIAEYYHFPIGEVIKTALPGGLTRKNNKVLQLVQEWRGVAPQWPPEQGAAPKWFQELLKNGALSATKTKKVQADKESNGVLKEWIKQGSVEVSYVLNGEQVKAKHELCYRKITNLQLPASIEGDDGKKALQLAAKEEVNGKKLSIPLVRTLVLLDELAKKQGQQDVAVSDIRKHYSGASKALLELEKRGMIEKSERRIFRNPFGEPLTFYKEPDQLTAEQLQVLATIGQALDEQSFSTFLLHGVTGCGKTEVYLQAATRTLAAGRDVLILVPEIALATQLEAHFISRFGEKVVLLHSGLSKGERYDQWSLAASGKAKVVIGARSAVFAPLVDPGLIIVDEEHDSAYKQEDGLRYQGRDLAVLRGYMNGAVVILGSGTPSISSYAKCESGKFTLLQMKKRVENRPLPEVVLIDLRKKGIKQQGEALGKLLQNEMELNLKEGKQTILLLNRRGYSSTYLCRDCGEPVSCKHCHVSLTYHKRKGELICHYCGFSLTENVVCHACNSGNLVPVGFGTERIEQEVCKKFPDARVARIDSDSARDRRKFLHLLKQMHSRELDILIGTQMIAKGHDFPHVTLVGVVWADGGLSIPDYKGPERTYQLLSQVAGRAGRGEYHGRVVIQTLRPEHYAIEFARTHDYERFYDHEMEVRRNPQFPPFVRMVNIKISGSREEQVQQTAIVLANLARRGEEGQIEVLGPAPSPIDRIRDRYRWQVLLKGANGAALHARCAAIGDHYTALTKGDIRITLDVDPESMM